LGIGFENLGISFEDLGFYGLVFGGLGFEIL
jgi:hypothetical protein